MVVKTEPVHTGEFIVSEGNNSISREQVPLAADLALLPGTVLGKNASDIYLPLNTAADDGTQVAAGILYSAVTTGATGSQGVIVARLAEVVESLLIFPDGITDEDKATALSQLRAQEIITRS